MYSDAIFSRVSFVSGWNAAAAMDAPSAACLARKNLSNVFESSAVISIFVTFKSSSFTGALAVDAHMLT